jgi:hypothetical protein
MGLLMKKEFKTIVKPINYIINKIEKGFIYILAPIPVILPFHILGLLWDFAHFSLIMMNFISIPL